MTDDPQREDAEMAEAEDRASQRADFDVEHLDAQGRTPDWHWCRGYGGGESVPW